jgi:hypothetical protein
MSGRKWWATGLVLAVYACSSSDDGNDGVSNTGGSPGATGGATVSTGGSTSTGGVTAMGGNTISTGGAVSAGGGPAGGNTNAGTGGTPPAATGGTPPAGSGGTAPGTGGAPNGQGGGQPKPPADAQDGDPSKPVVAIPNLACGTKTVGTNVNIGGRDVFVAYPCNKHAGAPMTFILNLHGTMATENLKLYGAGYFAAQNYASTHNLIVAAPKAIGSQWGREDNGADEPHLMAVIDWVYTNFKDFDIRGMWVAGHSWGAIYTAQFGCKAELADKVRGLVLMSGGGSASCAGKIAQIISTAEGDGRQPPSQDTVASGHGCGSSVSETFLQNDHTFWPNCQPGFVHANYYMRGKEHATFMDKEVVESIVNWIKLGRN